MNNQQQQIDIPALLKMMQAPAQQDNGNIIANAGADIGQNIQGIASLPGFLGNILSGKISPIQAGQAFGGGIANEYGQLISDPVGHFIQHPINSILDVLPFTGIAGKLSTLGRASETAGLAGEAAGVTGDVLKGGSSFEGVMKAFNSKVAKVGSTKTGFLKDNFNILPENSKFAEGDFKTLLAEDGGLGVGNAGQVAQKVRSTILTPTQVIKDEMLGAAQADGVQVTTGDIFTASNKAFLNSTDIPRGRANVYIDDLSRMQPKLLTGKSGNIGGADPMDFGEQAKQIRSKGYQMMDQATSNVDGSILNGEKYAAGRIYADTGKEMIDALGEQIGNKYLLATPRAQAAFKLLQSQSPSFAQKVASAENYGHLNQAEAPYVRTAMNADYTIRKGGAPVQQLVAQTAGAFGGAAGGMAGFASAGPVGAAGGAFMGGMLGNVGEKALSRFVPQVTSRMAYAPGVSGVAKVASPTGLAALGLVAKGAGNQNETSPVVPNTNGENTNNGPENASNNQTQNNTSSGNIIPQQGNIPTIKTSDGSELPTQLPNIATMQNQIPGQPYSQDQQLADIKRARDLVNANPANPMIREYANTILQQTQMNKSINDDYINRYVQQNGLSGDQINFMRTAPVDYNNMIQLHQLLQTRGAQNIVDTFLQAKPPVQTLLAAQDPRYALLFNLMDKVKLSAGQTAAGNRQILEFTMKQFLKQYQQFAPVYGLTTQATQGNPLQTLGVTQ